MRDAFRAQQTPNLGGIDLMQADMSASGSRDRPGKEAPIAVEHRQRLEVDGRRCETGAPHHGEGLEVGTPVVIHHPFRLTRGPRGVVDRQKGALVRQPDLHGRGARERDSHSGPIRIRTG
jgi:hypothetical protein